MVDRPDILKLLCIDCNRIFINFGGSIIDVLYPMIKRLFLILLCPAVLCFWQRTVLAQTGPYTDITMSTTESYQTVTGFGASLAYYENWLTAHPKKAEIYDVVFKELSLDILRVRNAYGYDNTMITRVKEFYQAAQKSLGRPIDIMVTSWGPPGYLKSNNDRNNGGTLKYSVSGGKVNFQYGEFARWWNQSLDNYNANGIYPTYISIQNEPDWKASYESCLLKPSETINATDTIAGYNKALDAVYDTLMKRSVKPKLLGPECIGIGYNAVENYVNALSLSKLYGIAHHLYHGADETDPLISTDFTKVGNFKPAVPHFQTEYSRGDWFPMAGMIYKTFNDENGVAYFFWDLIWDNGGLVDVDFPWDVSRWSNPQGYTRTKHFFVFKQFSAWIHPGWKRVKVTTPSIMVKSIAFLSTNKDSATVVAINTSATTSYGIHVTVPGYTVKEATVTRTSASVNGVVDLVPADSVALKPKSITTVSMKISAINTGAEIKPDGSVEINSCSNNPNPFRESTTLQFTLGKNSPLSFSVFDYQGRRLIAENIGLYMSGEHNYVFKRGNLSPGIYLYKIETPGSDCMTGRFTICD
jgi:glucuronoarabinoxylan endo-1,4-beta-xylanase